MEIKGHAIAGQLVERDSYLTATGAANTFAVTSRMPITAYTAGLKIRFKANAANTASATLNVNGLGAVTIKKNVSSDLAANDILADQVVYVVYDGTNFQAIGIGGAGTIAEPDTQVVFGTGASVDSSSDFIYKTSNSRMGLGMPFPMYKMHVSQLYYNTGTASRSGTTITGVGTTFTSAMVGKLFIFADGTTSLITAFTNTTTLTVANSGTVGSQAYGIYHYGIHSGSDGGAGYMTYAYGFAAPNPLYANSLQIGVNTTYTAGIGNGIIIGDGATGNGVGIALGVNANAAEQSVAVGFGATAGFGSLAFGNFALASGSNCTIVLGSLTTTSAVLGNQPNFHVGHDTYGCFVLTIGKGEGGEASGASPLTIQPTWCTGTDAVARTIIIAGGRATGNAAGGPIEFHTSDAGSSGTSLQGLSRKVKIDTDGTLILGVTSTRTGQMQFCGSTSGVITVKSQNAAGTWTFILPTTVGNADESLVTNGTSTGWVLVGISGVYTPTLSNTTNISSSTAVACQWMRVRDVVTVSGKVTITPTTETLVCVLGLTLPIASSLGNDRELAGTGGIMNGTSVEPAPVVLYADATNDRAFLKFMAPIDGAPIEIFFHFTYQIIA